MRRLNVLGHVYGRLTIVGDAPSRGDKRRYVRCLCSCGNEKIADLQNLRAGWTSSCGCWHDESPALLFRTHGRSKTPEYGIWSQMKNRCTKPKVRDYPRYGGRGITVCERWLHSFENFIADVGARPSPAHTIDRINNDGNYEPGNVRWVTGVAQNQNKSSVHLLTYNGETLCQQEWARRFGLPRETIATRLRKGWSVEKALTTPQQKNQYG